jgi:hypothetical protein
MANGWVLSRWGKAEPVPFSAQQVQLLSTFADQAVIAIENVRLFEAEQARTRELTGVIATADGHRRRAEGDQPLDLDLKVVLNTLVASAARLCEADQAGLVRPKAMFCNLLPAEKASGRRPGAQQPDVRVEGAVRPASFRVDL